ncbi:MAG: 3-deoxy-D-manno-octulosonic acid kinase, partial [Sinobacteraceae bacterium]|nr:3-deoxy-D-manno-octulosonic acid kinase [Nevskiaceae bacterium]
QGRATAHFLRGDAGARYVLRHYRRGGLMAHLSADRFAWRGEERTRPFAEWQLTYRLHRAGLPVAAPVAARYTHTGSTYTGDILTERLSVVGSLAECLRTGALATLTWIAIGRCIRRFHDLGVCHADLNAHNVLLSEESVYLIDFDRCQLRGPGLWRDGNLVRLRRSLEKVTWGLPAERFGESDWHALLDGYRQSVARGESPSG